MTKTKEEHRARMLLEADGSSGILLEAVVHVDRYKAALEEIASLRATMGDGVAVFSGPAERNCRSCRYRWHRKGTCTAAVDDNSPGRPWLEPDYRPPWCPGWERSPLVHGDSDDAA